MSVRVKICGLTNPSDASEAVQAGADALGFIFYQASPRYINPDAVSIIIRQLPPFIAKVGVFVDSSVQEIRDIAGTVGLDTIQLHGNESQALCNELSAGGIKVVKAVRVKDRSSLEGLKEFRVSALLLDSFVPGQLGGTGAAFNWDLALEAKALGAHVILAGGLTPLNVADAIKRVQPFAVDVSSGVESSPGKKDIEKMREFIGRAKGI